jgi:DNA-binding transcriptional LysR family regulator
MRNRTRDLNITHVRSFVHVIDSGSITAAAPLLGYSQPGLSQRIRVFEHTLGRRLLIRGSQGVKPTPAGTSVLPYARMLLAIYEAMRDEANRQEPQR